MVKPYWVIGFAAALAVAITAHADDGDQFTRAWRSNVNGVGQNVTVSGNSDGVKWRATVQGNDGGSPAVPAWTVPQTNLASGSRTPGGSNQQDASSGRLGGPGLSGGLGGPGPRPLAPVVSIPSPLEPSNGGANTISLGGPTSYETGPDGKPRPIVGRSAVGGWSFPMTTPPTDTGTQGTNGPGGATTGWAPVGPVPQIDPRAVAAQAEGEAPVPPITLQVNPNPGVVAVSSWFWVAGYDGRTISNSKTVSASHTECRLNDGEVQCRSVDDSVTVEIRLTPASYRWDFGDGQRGSVQSFPNPEGLGRRYTDPQHASPVQWSYGFSSYGQPNGFPIHLTVTFDAVFSANGGAVQALPPLDHTYDANFVVRQSVPTVRDPRQHP